MERAFLNKSTKQYDVSILDDKNHLNSVTKCVLPWIKISALITEWLFSITGRLSSANRVSSGIGKIISMRTLHHDVEVSFGKLLEKELNFSFNATVTGLELM